MADRMQSRRSTQPLALALLIHAVRATGSSKGSPVAPPPLPQGCAPGSTLPMEDCFESRECCHEGFECFKRPGLDYAQCRNSVPMVGWPAPTNCSDPEAGFTCPEDWVGCADRYHDCTSSKCCVQDDHGCYKAVGMEGAICRPLREGCNSAEWSCPGTWEHCTDNFKDCIETKCCMDQSFECVKHAVKDYAECRPKSSASCTTAPAHWACAGSWERCARPHGECFDSKCCTTQDHGCFRHAEKDTAQCRPRVQNCQSESIQGPWVCPGDWKHCADKHASCTDSKCCANAGFGCFKSLEAQQGECRPLDAEACDFGSGVGSGDGDEWLCPSAWSNCSAKYQPCGETKCCKEPNFGCFRNALTGAAECREYTEKDCVEVNGWKCPGTWEVCATDFDDCKDSLCCESENFACKRRRNLYGDKALASCRPTSASDSDCDGPGAQWLCPGWERCSEPMKDCFATRCCMDSDFTCYKETEHKASCLPTGRCLSEIPSGLCTEWSWTMQSSPPPTAGSAAAMRLQAEEEEVRLLGGVIFGITIGAVCAISLLGFAVAMLWRYLKEHERKYGKVLRSDGGVAEMTGLPRLCAVGATQEASNGDVRGAAGAC